MCVTAIGNLTQASIKEGRPRTKFSKEKDIIPFIEAHWEGMTTTSRRVTQSWHSTVSGDFNPTIIYFILLGIGLLVDLTTINDCQFNFNLSL